MTRAKSTAFISAMLISATCITASLMLATKPAEVSLSVDEITQKVMSKYQGRVLFMGLIQGGLIQGTLPFWERVVE